MSCITLSGVRRPLPRLDRAHDLTPRQRTNRRNAFWLFALEVGMHDPASGHNRPHTVAQIATLFKVSTRTVQEGIARARKVRELAGTTRHA